MTPSHLHRLEGLEADNLLAFLALLGTLRAIERACPELRPRAAWSIDEPPLRPHLHVAQAIERDALADVVAQGVDTLARAHDFEGRADLNFAPGECRTMLEVAAREAGLDNRDRADLLAALMHDGAVKDSKTPVIEPTPLCLLFGQGHQHFLQRLVQVPRLSAPPPRERGKPPPTAAQALAEALFETWHRGDATPSFRWDPAEDVRYATMGGDPTDAVFKTGTQHGANRLAAVALPLFKLGVQQRSGRMRVTLPGGGRDAHGAFSIAWPVWQQPMTVSAIAALLAHPDLQKTSALAHLGVVQVFRAERISVGKFMNITRARVLA